MHVLSVFPADNIFPIHSTTFLSSGKLVLILFINGKLCPDAAQPKVITQTSRENAAQDVISSGHGKQHIKTGLFELRSILPRDHRRQTSLDTGHIFTQISPAELFSELTDVCPTMSSNSAVYQTAKCYSILTTCPQQPKWVVFPKFISKSSIWDQKTFSHRNNFTNTHAWLNHSVLEMQH